MPDERDAAKLNEAQAHMDRVRDLLELAHLIVDFIAGISFVVGSVMFFAPSWERTAIWLFLVGSICFAAKPTIRLLHKIENRRTRRRLEGEVSAEVVEELRRMRPVRPFTH